MNHIADYAYLNARVAVLASNLLSENRLRDILNQPLGQQHTGLPTLDNLLNDEHITTSMVEQAWISGLLADFQVLVRPLNGAAREVLTHWLRKYEITNLKTIIRGKLAGLETPTIAAQLLLLEPIATLPLEKLLQMEDISELLRHLDDTPYGNIARQARRVFEQEHQAYSLDAAIDRHYLLELDKRLHALNIAQRNLLMPLMSIFMDRFNLLWLLRYRFAYHLSPAETYYLLIPTHYRLNRTNLMQLVEATSLPEVLTQLPVSLHRLVAEATTVSTVEQLLNAEVRRVATYILEWHHFSLAKAIAYITLRELEMHRILAIVKGKRLQLKTEHILAAAELADVRFS